MTGSFTVGLQYRSLVEELQESLAGGTEQLAQLREQLNEQQALVQVSLTDLHTAVPNVFLADGS